MAIASRLQSYRARLEPQPNRPHARIKARGTALRPHFLVYFDDVPSKHTIEAVGDDWGNVESLAMRTADNELRCDRLKIEKIDTAESREYHRNTAGIWFRLT